MSALAKPPVNGRRGQRQSRAAPASQLHPQSTTASNHPSSASGTVHPPQTNSRLELTPMRGEFINFDVDTTYVMSFNIRNRTPEIQTLRFIPPQKPQTAFRLVNVESVRVAPGLSHVVDVEFSTHITRDYEDVFTVLNSNGERLDVELVAHSVPKLEFGTNIYFGKVEHNRMDVAKSLHLINRGRKDAVVTLVPSETSGLTINPSIVVARALGETSVTIELTTLPIGVHHWPISVTVDGEKEPREVMAHVEIVDCRSTLVDPSSGQEAVSVGFAKVYAGSKKRYELVVVNGSEQGVSFAFQLANEMAAKEAPPFHFKPEQGRLGPKERRTIAVEFAPPINPVRKGWSCLQSAQKGETRKFEALFSLLFVETEQTHNFHIVGESAETEAWISRPVLDFGECPMNDYRDESIELFNGVLDLPLNYTFDHVPNFRIDKGSGVVPPGGSKIINITYQPRRLGKYSEKLKVEFNGTVSRVVTLIGYSSAMTPEVKATMGHMIGGTDKLPGDFKRPRHAPDRPRPADDVSADDGWRPTAVDQPQAVDIGMIPGEGMRAPQPSTIIPPRELQEEDAALRGPSGHVAPISFDTKTLIKRRYPEVPGNAMERRDCRRELMPMDLLKVVAPIKVVQFDRITVGASAVKSFYVYNGTNASILVTMPGEEPHTQFSPLSQVIPTNRMAQFDVCLCSSIIQQCMQVIQFTVNNHHRMRFTLQAEVVPVEVAISQKEAVLNFSEFTDEPITKTTVTLANNGNSDACYSWVLPPKVPFTISPDGDVLAPMSKAIAEITFTPPQGVLETSCEAILKVEGATEEKRLSLTGVVAPTLCSWTKKLQINGTGDAQVDLRRIAAGQETSVAITLMNRGTNNAYYSFDPLPQWLSITPSHGRVCKGESEELIFTVLADTAEAIQHVVLCNVRGMRKPLRMSLTAHVIAPTLTITSPERTKGEIYLDYGEVYVGTECTRKIQFKNTGDVPAVVQMDLHAHPGFFLQIPDKSGADDTEGLADVVFKSNIPNNVRVVSATNSATSLSTTEAVPGLYVVTIPPNTESWINILYSPQAAQSTTKTTVRWVQVGSGDSHPLPPLLLVASALPSRLAMTTKCVKFPEVVAGRVPKPYSLMVQNLTDEQIPWSLEVVDGQGRPTGATDFLVEPSSGSFAPLESQTVTITFLANNIGQFNNYVRLMADGDRSKPCAELMLVATATKPRLLTDQRVIIFPPVPLGVEVKETIFVINDGFDSITVDYEGECSPPVSVSFPRGNILSFNTKRIPVEISFMSSKPITVASSITFTSNRNEQITVSICGTAINSILSTFGFVKYREKQSTIGCSTGIDPDKTQPFMIRDSKGTAPGAVVINYGDKATAQRTLESFTFGMLDATGRHVYGRAAVENITRWVNGNILRSPVENIVETLQLSHGGIMYDIIERLFGRRPKPADSLEEKQSGGKQRGSTRVKKIQSAQSAAPVASTSTKKSSIDRGLVTIETLLSFIKAYGCCLSSVRSKFLLTYEEYLQLVSRDESFGPPLSALLFMVRSSHAWVTVLLETIRVFYMSRLRMDAVLKTTPALTKYLPMDRWNSRSFAEAMENSNVYSPDESLLLQWVRCSLDKYNTVEVTFAQHKLRVVNFDDLRDARVLLAAVLLYVPAIRPFCIGADRQIVSNPVSSVEHETNAYVLLSALTELGATDLPTPKEYLELSQLDYTLFAAFLMNMLPRFIATETIHFEGRLLASITKTIEVVNASNIARQYRVMMENTDFTVSAKELTVAPNSTATLNIIFRPKYHRVVEGRCLIVDHSPVFPEERGHLAFDLKATPNTEPSKVIQLESPLYETLNTDIAIESPFPTDCVVSLRAVQEFLDPAEGEDSYAETEFGRNYKHAFFVHTDVLPLRRNEATKLPLQFIPLCRGKYQLKIFFREDREGEFSYLVNATCTSPKPSEAKIDFRSELGEDCFPGVTVRASHSAFERSVRLFEERSRQFQTIMRNVGLPDMSGNVYTVSFLNEHMQGPNPFFEMAGGNNVVALPADGSSGSLRFSFKPKYIGQYTGFIMLTSPIDVRLLRFSGECVPKGERHMLHFACPARQTISQDITINNNTNKDWLITATLEGESFSGLKELRVPKGKHKEYSLKFSPAWISKDEEKGTLVLQNNATGQKHTYALVGEADSPLSEDTITIECRAREHQTVMLNVPNVATTDCTYFVETDLPFAQGDTSVIIPRASFSKYTLNIMPTVGGNYSGKVVFKSHQGRYVWYVINVRVTPPEREGIIDMRTDVRTSIVADVRITNPLNKALIFSVRRYGAGLFGENFLKMEALETLTYSCLFVPANIGEFDGRLSFCNDEIGEFWYALKMFVDDSQPEELAFESTLGVPTSARVKLPNMTEVDCPLTIRNTNPINFSVSPAVVVLPSNSEALIDISYTPTAVGVRQEGTVTLSHHQLGEWKYACNGIGSPPEPEKKRTCVCEVGASTTLSLPFTNTFDVDAELTISLTGNDSAFFSVKKGLDGIVPAGASTTILLAYTPKSVGQHSTTVEVQPTNAPPQYNVQWSYPIEGTSEWREATAPFRFLCVARKQHEDLILLRAPGLTPEEKVGATVMYSPDARQHYVSAVVSSFECSLVDSPYPDAFQVAIKFSPLRPMAATGDLLVKGLDGGAWRYRVYLEATPSPIDDTVLLRSAYNTSTAVVFDLYNVFPFKSKFVAYFTGDSSKDFSVAPSHGVLLPFVAGQRTASAATPIRIAFCPSTRVPQVEGTLVVDTDDMQWSFRVIGKLDHQARIAPQRSS